jgi:hypothetical protein
MYRTQDERERGAATFSEMDVARSYRARPPYPPALFEALLGEVPGRGRALDLGCAQLFPKLARWTTTLAVIVGDAPISVPCGDAAWAGFVRSWLSRMSDRTSGAVVAYDRAAFERELQRHEIWMDLAGRARFPFVFRQSVEDFITCQHSRATWSRAVMGDALASAFDDQLRALLGPFATDGVLDLPMVTELSWGRPLAAPRA